MLKTVSRWAIRTQSRRRGRASILFFQDQGSFRNFLAGESSNSGSIRAMAVGAISAYIEPCGLPPLSPTDDVKERNMNRRDMLVRTGAAALTVGLGDSLFPR